MVDTFLLNAVASAFAAHHRLTQESGEAEQPPAADPSVAVCNAEIANCGQTGTDPIERPDSGDLWRLFSGYFMHIFAAPAAVLIASILAAVLSVFDVRISGGGRPEDLFLLVLAYMAIHASLYAIPILI